MGPQLEFVGATEVLYEGERFTFFGGNDYHRFSRHPEVLAALSEAAEKHGFNTAGSRITTANHALYFELERRIAGYLGTEDALVCSAGYLSAIVLLQGVAREFHSLFLDETAHASLVDAALTARKPVHCFKHADPESLESTLEAELRPGQRPLVLTDGIFASIGDLAPLAAYAEIVEHWNGRIVTDDAHAVGVIGCTGRGSWEEAGVPREIVYQVGTLSKGLGGFGGFVAGTRAEMDAVRAGSRAFKGGTPMPLPVAAASIKAIDILAQHPEKIALLRERTENVKARLGTMYTLAAGPAPICSVTCFDAQRNLELGERLKRSSIFPSFIDYPGSPPGGHYRFTLSSAHTEEQIERLCRTVESP